MATDVVHIASLHWTVVSWLITLQLGSEQQFSYVFTIVCICKPLVCTGAEIKMKVVQNRTLPFYNRYLKRGVFFLSFFLWQWFNSQTNTRNNIKMSSFFFFFQWKFSLLHFQQIIRNFFQVHSPTAVVSQHIQKDSYAEGYDKCSKFKPS